MPTIEQFKQIRASVSPAVQAELYGLVIQDLDAAVQKMIGIGIYIELLMPTMACTPFICGTGVHTLWTTFQKLLL